MFLISYQTAFYIYGSTLLQLCKQNFVDSIAFDIQTKQDKLFCTAEKEHFAKVENFFKISGIVCGRLAA